MNQENKPETVEHKIDSSLIVAAHENAGNHNYSHHIYKGFIDGANWQASQHSYPEQKGYENAINEVCKILNPEIEGHESLYHQFQSLLALGSASTPPTYTQEQMIAFGEAIKQECILNAEVRSLEDDSHHVYEWIVDEQSILSIDISKLLNK